MSLPRPTIVLFDMDGTTVRHINPKLLGLLEALDDFAHKTARLFSKLIGKKIDAPPLVGFQGTTRRKLLVHRAIHKFRRKEVDEIVEPCPGIYDILDLLQACDIPMALVSNGLGKGYGHDILEKFDLAHYFEATIFREDIRRSKPHPDPLLQALEAMNHKTDANDVIWYIGDRKKDIKAALAARAHLPCTVVPLAYGLNAAIAVLENHLPADHIVMAWPDMTAKLMTLLAEDLANLEPGGKRDRAAI